MKTKETNMNIKALVMVLVCLCVTIGFGRSGNDFEDVNFCSLPLAIDCDLHDYNTIYELDESGSFGVVHVNDDGTVVARRGSVYVLIVTRSNDVVDNQMIYGPRYYRYAGTGKFSFSAVDRTSTVRKFKEVSQREFEKIEAFRQELLARIEEQKREARRMNAIKKALAELSDLTDDEKVVNFTYQKVGEKYDETYRKTRSEAEAEAIANEAAATLLEVLKKDLERQQLQKEKEFREWAKSHPEEYAEMLKAEELERQKKAKARLDAELAANAKKMDFLKKIVEEFKSANDLGKVPQSIDELRQFERRRLLPKYDEWHVEFAYNSGPEFFEIISAGPDKKKGTTDDITLRIEAMKDDRSPLAQKISGLRDELHDLKMKVNLYKGEFMPSICGYRFGAPRPAGFLDMERVVMLAKPFRSCKEAVVRYHGETDPRLTSVVLLGRFPQAEDGLTNSRVEGEKIMALMTRNYKTKFSMVSTAGNFVATSQASNFKVEIRNDVMLNDGGDDIILTVEYEDRNLSLLIDKIDAVDRKLGTAEGRFAALQRETPGQVHRIKVQNVDDEGLDVLTGNSSEDKSKSAVDETKPPACSSETQSQIESIRNFRKQMEEMRKMRRQAVPRIRPTKGSGIIESKGEGRPISTTD